MGAWRQIVGGIHKRGEMEATAFQGRHLKNVSSTQHKLISRSHRSEAAPLAFKSHVSASDLKKTQA